MDVTYKALPESDDRIVYVREVAVEDLPDDIRVRDREMAFVLARQNDFAPVTVH